MLRNSRKLFSRREKLKEVAGGYAAGEFVRDLLGMDHWSITREGACHCKTY